MVKNKQGLSRHIPIEVQREVRSRSKNGCVICRNILYEYEHFDPAFSEAVRHEPQGICLLCPSCHRDVTSGRISKDDVRKAYDKVQQSEDVKPPFYKAKLTGRPTLVLGNARMDYLTDTASILRYDGESILSIGLVEDDIFGGVRPSVTGIILDYGGNVLLDIEDNLITLATRDVDIELKGQHLTIRNPSGSVVLKVGFYQNSQIQIHNLRMRYMDIVLHLDDTFGVCVPLVDGHRRTFLFDQIEAKGVDCVFDYSSDRTTWPTEDALEFTGGKGIRIGDSGCKIAVGDVSILLKFVAVYEGDPGSNDASKYMIYP